MSGYLKHVMSGAAVSLAIITMGSTGISTASAATAAPDRPRPGVTLGVATEGNGSTDLFYTGTRGQVWMGAHVQYGQERAGVLGRHADRRPGRGVDAA